MKSSYIKVHTGRLCFLCSSRFTAIYLRVITLTVGLHLKLFLNKAEWYSTVTQALIFNKLFYSRCQHGKTYILTEFFKKFQEHLARKQVHLRVKVSPVGHKGWTSGTNDLERIEFMCNMWTDPTFLLDSNPLGTGAKNSDSTVIH